LSRGKEKREGKERGKREKSEGGGRGEMEIEKDTKEIER
jgi:hypothetical protein